MFKPKRPKFGREIDHVLIRLGELDPESPEYSEAVQNLKSLSESKKLTGIDWNTVMSIGGQVVITVLVLQFEKTGVVTSKIAAFWRRMF